MDNSDDALRVNVVVDIAPRALEAIVTHAKQTTGRDAKGVYRVDTADRVGEMISRFLKEKDFTAWVDAATA